MIIVGSKRSLLIRNIKEKDTKELYELLKEGDDEMKQFFHPHLFDMKTVSEICKSQKDHYFIMILKDKIVGYSMLRLFNYETPSFGCCIRTGYQRKGFGTILTEWTINKAKKLGYRKVILKVYKSNKNAFRIYKNIGFIIVGETEDKKQYKMEKNLI